MPNANLIARRAGARQIRRDAAELAFQRPQPLHLANDEEADYPYIANYSKGLPHDPATGEVDPKAYGALLRALASGNPQDFERVPLGTVGGRRLTNPQSGL